MATEVSDPSAPSSPVGDDKPASPDAAAKLVTAPEPVAAAATASEPEVVTATATQAATEVVTAPATQAATEAATAAEAATPAAAPAVTTTEAGAVTERATAAPAAPETAVAPTKPGGAVELHLVGRTDVGLVREHNEDNYTCVRLDDDTRDPDQLLHHTLIGRGTLLCVCDGMGGAAAGEVASTMAVATLPEIMRGALTAPTPEGTVDDPLTALARQLRFASEEANRRIFSEQQTNLARSGMGTTMTAAVLRGDHAVIAQVGDSRCYIFRRGTLTQVTRDQSLVNQLLETGQITVEQAKYFEHSNVILQALGVQEDVEVQLSRVHLRRGDRILLCSDGLVGVVADEEIASVLGSVADPADAARLLIELANGAGGPDNITVVVAKINGEGLAEPTETDVITYQTWRIDPDIEAPPEPEGFAPAEPVTVTLPPVDPAPRVSARPAVRPIELFSMATVIGLLIGSVLVGLAMYRRAVPCHVRATRAGLMVTADGRDSGARTIEGEVPLRLRPGRHRIGLVAPRRGADVVQGVQEVDVRAGDECTVTFEERATAAPTDDTPAADPRAQDVDHPGAEAAAGSVR